MSFELPIRLMREGYGNLNYSRPPGGAAPPAPPFALNSADNGLSVDPTSFKIVLGQDIGEAGNPAQLLSNREIPMNGHNIIFTDFADFCNGMIFQASVTKQLADSYFEFSDSDGNEIGRVNFLSDIDTGGDGGSLYMGRHSGENDPFPNGNNVGIGWRTLEAMNGGFGNTAVGYENQTLLTTGQQNTSMGASVFNNLVDGSFNASFGDSSAFNLVSGQHNSFFGSGSGQGFYGASTNNAVFGTSALMIGAPSPVIDDNNVFGNLSFIDGGSQFGNRNILIGNHNNEHAGIITDDNIVIGNNNQVDTISNSMVFGSGFTVSGLPNVIILGNSTQRTLLGQTNAAPVDDGINRLQVNGSEKLFGLSAGDFVFIDPGDISTPTVQVSSHDVTVLPSVFQLSDVATGNNAVFRMIPLHGNIEAQVGMLSGASAMIHFTPVGTTIVDSSVSPYAADTGERFQVYGNMKIDTVIAPIGGHSSNVLGWDTTNHRVVTKGTSGSASFSGNGILVSFAVNHNLGQAPAQVLVTPTSISAASLFYVSAKGGTTFTVTYLVAPGVGVNNITFDWQASNQ